MTLGIPPIRQGEGGPVKTTEVPVGLVQHFRQFPNAITISGTGNVIFTLAGSKTRPVRMWGGDDYFHMDENLSYTWAATNDVLSTSGAAATLEDSALTAVPFYFYLGINTAGNYVLRPSVSAPSYVEGPFQGSVLGHPGTARAQFWQYVGFMANTATDPTFEAMIKTGYTYNFAPTSVASTSTWAEVDFSFVVPKHGEAGMTVAGTLETSAEGSIAIGSASTSTFGQQKAGGFTSTNGVLLAGFLPYSGIVPTANGKVWAADGGARGDVFISSVTDVV